MRYIAGRFCRVSVRRGSFDDRIPDPDTTWVAWSLRELERVTPQIVFKSRHAPKLDASSSSSSYIPSRCSYSYLFCPKNTKAVHSLCIHTLAGVLLAVPAPPTAVCMSAGHLPFVQVNSMHLSLLGRPTVISLVQMIVPGRAGVLLPFVLW